MFFGERLKASLSGLHHDLVISEPGDPGQSSSLSQLRLLTCKMRWQEYLYSIELLSVTAPQHVASRIYVLATVTKDGILGAGDMGEFDLCSRKIPHALDQLSPFPTTTERVL